MNKLYEAHIFIETYSMSGEFLSDVHTEAYLNAQQILSIMENFNLRPRRGSIKDKNGIAPIIYSNEAGVFNMYVYF